MSATLEIVENWLKKNGLHYKVTEEDDFIVIEITNIVQLPCGILTCRLDDLQYKLREIGFDDWYEDDHEELHGIAMFDSFDEEVQVYYYNRHFAIEPYEIHIVRKNVDVEYFVREFLGKLGEYRIGNCKELVVDKDKIISSDDFNDLDVYLRELGFKRTCYYEPNPLTGLKTYRKSRKEVYIPYWNLVDKVQILGVSICHDQ